MKNSKSKDSSTPTSNDINLKTGIAWKRYCHTHGCCNYWDRHCKNKAPGHKDKATFQNCMGGSNFNRLPIQDWQLRWAGQFNSSLNTWLHKITNKCNEYHKPVASYTTKTISSQSNIAKLDSGALQHFIKTLHKNQLTDIKKLCDGPDIPFPNNQQF